jgi:N-acetylmuramoyl-L-alanine amidase-like protein/Big-like domain-containing protein
MPSLRRLSSLAGVLLALACANVASAGVQITYVPASPANYSHTKRPASAIRLIVVHVTEGTYESAVSWFRNPHARASANYVVSREGAITQMVPNSEVAWHSGNGWVNRHSIGVEDEGFTKVSGTFTDAEYRASAQLVASLMRRYHVPIDRRHLIGHNQVPDPFHPGLYGGISHHTDPGRYWNWARYLGYVRSFARGVTPPPLPFDVTTSEPGFGQTVSGSVPWSAAPTGEAADHVDFLVDGHLRDTQRTAPYAFGGALWDTTRETNGRHVLSVRAVTSDETSATSSIVVDVKNPPIRISGVTLAEGQTVSGAVHLEARVRGTPLRVEFLIDGVLRETETATPYVFGGATGTWDTTQETQGAHTIIVRAIGPTQKPVATRTIHVIVANP